MTVRTVKSVIDYTVTAADHDTILLVRGSTVTFGFTLPIGFTITIINVGGGQVSLVAPAQEIHSPSATLLTEIWQSTTICKIDSNEWVMTAEEPQQDYVSVGDFGAVGDGVADDTAAIQAAIDASTVQGIGPVIFPPGSYRVTETITYPSDFTISGAGAQTTIIDFTGTGYAFAPVNPNVRSFNSRFQEFTITIDAVSDGGIDLTGVSLAELSGVVVFGSSNGAGGGFGFHVAGVTNGDAVYNRFDHCRALTMERGFDIAASGSNDTHINDCRAANCLRGVSIVDSNHTVLDTCCFESGATGVHVEATINAVADATTIICCRFEGNATSNITFGGGTPANIRDPRVIHNAHVTGTPITGTPTRLQRLEPEAVQCVSATADTPFRLERTVASTFPGLHVVDSNQGSLAPITIQSTNDRGSGSFFRGVFQGVTRFDATAAGDLTILGDFTCDDVVADAATFTGAVALHTAGQVLTLGDGSTAGNVTLVHRKADANNLTGEEWRVGASTMHWLVQFDTAENLNWMDSTATVIGGWQKTGNYWRAYLGVRLVSASGPTITGGAGAPSAAEPDGSIYLRTDGAAGTTIYVRAAGAWSANA